MSTIVMIVALRYGVVTTMIAIVTETATQLVGQWLNIDT
jgi:hypothetical protein